MSEHGSWKFEEGEELQPGRAVLKTIGGGNRYEVCLVWDEAQGQTRTQGQTQTRTRTGS